MAGERGGRPSSRSFGGLLLLGLAWAIGGCGGGPSPADRAARWASVQAAIGAQRWDAAEADLKAIIAESPADPQARLALGPVLASNAKGAEADAVLKEILPTAPAFGQACSLRGELAIDRHDAPEAERLLRLAASKDPKGLVSRRRLVYLLSLQGRTGEVRDLLWEMYRINPDPMALLDLVLSAWGVENDTRGLIEQADPFLKATPDDPYLRRIVGLGLLQKGRPAEALPHLEAASARFAEDPTGRFALIECRKALGESVSSDGALGLPPAESAGRSYWRTLEARLLEADGKGADALKSLKTAIEENPWNREAHFRLGQLLQRSGDPAGGKAQLDRAEAIRRAEGLARREHERVRTAGFDRDAFERLARLCLDAGLAAEGRAWLELAIRADPTRQTAQAALAGLSGKESPYPYPLVSLKRIEASTASPSESEATPAPRPKEDGTVAFEDVAAAVGLKYTYDSGASGDLFIGDTMGGGVALIDYDRDGRLDIYFINGCRCIKDAGFQGTPNRLFRNRPDGTFKDVTARAGVAGRGYGMGAAVADYDGDGFDDLFVTGLGSTVLYRNRGDGTFEDATAKAGVSSTRWTTAAGFGDLDGDGDLDLVAVTYVDADPAKVFPCLDHAGKPIHCSPGRFQAQMDHLWRNNGDGTFTEVAAASGLDRPNGRGLGLAIADFDEDGKLDIFVANDASPNFLFRNLGGGKFEEVGESAGVALDGQGKPTASMGVVADDLDGDGLIDLFHTNFINEPNTFRRNLGRGLFVDATLGANLDASSRSKTGFGVAAIDADGDGRLDLFVSNGHVDDQPWIDTPMAQEAQLYWAIAPGRFRLYDGGGFPYLARKVVGRGVAMGDLDGDGAADLVVVHRDAPASLLLNRRPPAHWLGVRLMGAGKGRSAIGARVTCRSAGGTATRFLAGGAGYLSVHESVLRFTLPTGSFEEVEVRWPSGKVTKLGAAPGDRVLEVREAP